MLCQRAGLAVLCIAGCKRSEGGSTRVTRRGERSWKRSCGDYFPNSERSRATGSPTPRPGLSRINLRNICVELVLACAFGMKNSLWPLFSRNSLRRCPVEAGVLITEGWKRPAVLNR